MYETMVAYNMTEHIYGHAFDPPEDTMGYTRVLTPSRRPYKTSDGYICVLVYTDPQWKVFWQEAGRPELTDDPRFVNLGARSNNIEELYRIAGECFAQRSTAEWISVLERLEIPYAKIATLEDLLDDQHLSDIDFFKKAIHPTEGKIVMPDIPVRFSRTPANIDRLQPGFGEHGREILREAGLNENEIDQALSKPKKQGGKL